RGSLQQQPARDAVARRLLDELFIKRVHRIRRTRKLQVLLLYLQQHAPVFGRGLRRLGDNAEKIQGSPPALTFGVERFQVVNQRPAGTAVVGQLLLQRLPFTRQVSWDRQTRLDGREQLGFLLDDLSESLLHQAVQH